jgi:DNA modification methylase
MFEHFIIENPKRNGKSLIGRANWYPYCAGFSPNFVRSLLLSSQLNPNTCIVDPWNGSGTTTTIAASLGYNAYH